MTVFVGEVLIFIFLFAAVLIGSANIFKTMKLEADARRRSESEFKRRKAEMTGKNTLGFIDRYKQKIGYSLDLIKMPKTVFLMLVGGSTIVGFFFGKIILTRSELAIFMAALFSTLPIVFVGVRSSWYKHHEMASLETCMVTITGSYRATKDIVKAVRDNIDKTTMPVAFKNFLSEVTFVDSSIEKALRKVGASFDNKYFDEWIEILIKSQYDSHMMDLLPVIIDEMDEAKKAQNESSAAMKAVWREYALWVITCICVPLVLRLNAQWYDALVNTTPGKVLVILLLVGVANTFRAMAAISKAASEIM